jgi:hypothetical protein
LYLTGNETDPNIQSTWYQIDGGAWQQYTGPFTLAGRPLFPMQHMITYYSIDRAGNTEQPKNAYEIFIDESPPELQAPQVWPHTGTDQDTYTYSAVISEDTDPVFTHDPVGNQGVVVNNPQNDVHVRKAVGFDNNTHLVWMSDRDAAGRWEIYYKEMNPGGIAFDNGEGKYIVKNQTIISDTRISDLNTSDSMYPSLVIEPHQQVFVNDTIYSDRYAVLAGPIRYYYDQVQLLQNNWCWVNINPGPWQEFVAGINWTFFGQTDLWVDILIMKDPSLVYQNSITVDVYVKGGAQPIFSQTIPSSLVPDGQQWLAFYGHINKNLTQGWTYEIRVTSNDPYKWFYKSGNPYNQGFSSLDGQQQQFDFGFITRYAFPEIRFKYELNKMRECLLSEGFTDDHITFLTIPYYVYDATGGKVKWRIPYSDFFPTVVWQQLPFDFNEPWIDGNATRTEFLHTLTSIKENATPNDLVVVYLQDHGGRFQKNGRVGDIRVQNDEVDDGIDEAFGTYAQPNEWNVVNQNSVTDDELDRSLDTISYKDMVVVADTCFSGGFLPDCSGPHRVVVSCGREDEETSSYIYRIYERLQNRSADTDGNGWVSIEEAHAYAIQQIPLEQGGWFMPQNPQINVDESIHVVWADKRDGHNEIYYSKLHGVTNYSASPNGVDITNPDWRVSMNDGKDSGRIMDPFDGHFPSYIEHPDIAMDSRKNISIVWSDLRNATPYESFWEIYYQLQDNASNPQGIPITLIDDTRISNPMPPFPETSSICPVVDVDNTNNVHLAWQDTMLVSGCWEIMYEELNPYQDDCDGDIAVDGHMVVLNHDDFVASSNDVFDSASPAIAVDDDAVVHITFMDVRAQDPGHEGEGTHIAGQWEVYTLIISHVQAMGGQPFPWTADEKRQSDMKDPSTRYGVYTGPPDGYSMYPRIETTGKYQTGDTFLVWQDDRDGNWEIYYSEVSNVVSNPTADIRVSNEDHNDMYPDVALNRDNSSNIKWQTNRFGNWDIYESKWLDLKNSKVTIDGVDHHLLPLDPIGISGKEGGIQYAYGTMMKPGLHSYSFAADNGVLENETSVFIGPMVIDTTPPIISEVHAYPVLQYPGGQVNISGIVTDNGFVDTVKVNIHGPAGFPSIYEVMTKGSDDLFYDNRSYTIPGTYTFFIWANDTSNNQNTSDSYSFFILNNAPYLPHDPSPPNGATGVSINADLSWISGDPDPEDTVTYDVYFGSSTYPPKVIDNQTSTTYNLPTLAYTTQYFWRIVSWDNHGASTSGPLWTFTTESGVDPLQSYVTMTNENMPFLVTCPHSDGPAYQHVKVTVKNAGGTPIPGILASDFSFTINPTGYDTHWYGTLQCTFTAVDQQTNANGEIRFTMKGDTSIYGNITIRVTVQTIPLNDIDTLPCKSPDYDTNGAVSLGDFVTFASDYSKVRWRSDFTGDGLVSLGDFVLFAGHYAHHS